MKHRFQCDDCGRVVDIELAKNQLGPSGGCVCGDDDWTPLGPSPDGETDYHVVWEINVSAKTPEDAAREALRLVRGHGSTASVFDVLDADGNKTHIDILRLDEEEGECRL